MQNDSPPIPAASNPRRRRLGKTDLEISPVALGCWPIAGMTSLDVTPQESQATLAAAMEVGVNCLDTAYCYGASGESERLIAQAIRGRREEVVICTKGGLHWKAGAHVYDARPETLRQECEASLQRLETDRVELLYLHAPDPYTPLAESAGALAELQQAGKTRSVGASNLNFQQLQAFHAVCPLAAFQPPYNMLQREIEADILPWCQKEQISVLVYWPLLKGLLAGKLPRDFVFLPGDGRAKYPMFQGAEWVKNQDFLDDLRPIAAAAGKSVSQLVIAWTIQQPGITAALCGAKRPAQIIETAAAMEVELSTAQLQQIQAALARRGAPRVRGAV